MRTGAGNVWLIDKHAAHERINFDRLKASREPPHAPDPADAHRRGAVPGDGALLLENLPELERFGFACEDFGDGTVLVREVPADIDAGDTQSTLEEFAECLRTGRSRRSGGRRCSTPWPARPPIKGGWVSDPAELRVLVDKVQSGEVKYCPHRPPGGGEADEVRAGEDVQAGVTGAGESGPWRPGVRPIGRRNSAGLPAGQCAPIGRRIYRWPVMPSAPPFLFLAPQKEKRAAAGPKRKNASAGRSAPARTSCRRRGKVGTPAQ